MKHHTATNIGLSNRLAGIAVRIMIEFNEVKMMALRPSQKRKLRKYLHDKGLEKIVKRLEDDFIDWQLIQKQRKYGYKDETLGEVDVMAIKCSKNGGARMFIFEYKLHDGLEQRYKAEDQLARSKWFFGMKGYRVTPFYVHDDMEFEYQVI